MENVKNYTVGDWLKVASAVTAAAAGGFAAGGYVGLAVNLVSVLAAIFATPPGKVSVSNESQAAKAVEAKPALAEAPKK